MTGLRKIRKISLVRLLQSMRRMDHIVPIVSITNKVMVSTFQLFIKVDVFNPSISLFKIVTSLDYCLLCSSIFNETITDRLRNSRINPTKNLIIDFLNYSISSYIFFTKKNTFHTFRCKIDMY